MVGLQGLGPPDAGHHPRPAEADEEVSDGFLGKSQIDGVSRLRSLPCQSTAQPQSCNWEQTALCTHRLRNRTCPRLLSIISLLSDWEKELDREAQKEAEG